MPDVRGMTVVGTWRHNASVILLVPGKEGEAGKAFLKAEGVTLAEFLDGELPAVTFQALTRRLAEIYGLIGEEGAEND